MTQSIARAFERVRKSSAYWTERGVLDFTSALWQVMGRRGVSQADLARKLGKNPAFVSRVLNGTSNVTLKTMVEMAHAVDARMQINVVEAERTPIVAAVTVAYRNVPLILRSATRVTTKQLPFSAMTEFAANDSEHGTSAVA